MRTVLTLVYNIPVSFTTTIFTHQFSSDIFMMFRLFFLSIFAFSHSLQAQNHSFVVYNVENLFDADGIAVYEDYLPNDKDGNPNYTPRHVFVKIQNIVSLMQKFNDGRGPDMLALVELESDSSPDKWPSKKYFLDKYKNTSLEKMLTVDFDDSIKTLPSHLLLLKGFWDAGITDYDFAVAPAFGTKEGKPESVQQNALFSRIPINHSKTKRHKLERARPILEAWVKSGDSELVVFVNHWKSGSSDYKQELVRIQNAGVLRDRIDELTSQNPNIDIIVSGDLNSDYNQKYRYKFEKAAVNDVLKSIGDENLVASGKADLFNLWYELPANKRGSDVYRGNFGTLMHIVVNSGLYDFNGWQYSDNSFKVGRFSGFNSKSYSNAPVRWFGGENPGGYSDHYPLYLELNVTSEKNPKKKILLENPSKDDGKNVVEVPITFELPSEGSYRSISELTEENQLQLENEMFLVEGIHKGNGEIETSIGVLPTYGPGFNFKEALQKATKEDGSVAFFATLNRYRGKWQWYIDSPIFIQ